MRPLRRFEPARDVVSGLGVAHTTPARSVPKSAGSFRLLAAAPCGRHSEILSDAGYRSEGKIEEMEKRGNNADIATSRQKHGTQPLPSPGGWP